MAKQFEGPGGTPGGLGSFLLGAGMAVAGAYLILQETQVHSGYWQWFGPHTFGFTLIPLIFGVGLLFFDGASVAGWMLSGSGAVILFSGILTNLDITFRNVSLFSLLVMLTLLAGGLGLMARSLRPARRPPSGHGDGER